MSSNLLSPNTSMALMQATQGKVGDKPTPAEIEKATEAAKEFEAVFVSEMMKPMFEGIQTDGMFGGGKGEEVFRSMLLQEYGKLMSQTGSVGVADTVREEMIRMQSKIDTGTDIIYEQ
jgi:peptidoglycan hydrolase FlgJ